MGWPPFTPTFDDSFDLPGPGEDPDALLERLTNPDNEDIDRNHVLRLAVQSRDWIIAQAQLDLGADVNDRDENGMSAMDYAGDELREKLTAYFSEKHASRVKALRARRRGLRP